MLGFRGHFATKSRGYSTTFSALRAERANYTAAVHADALGLPADDTVLVVNNWRYAGRGTALGVARPPSRTDRTAQPGRAGVRDDR